MNDDNDGNIIVALAADLNYFKGLLVTSCSMARHAREDIFITWVILDGGIGEEGIGFLQHGIQKDHRLSSFRIIKFDIHVLKGVATLNGSVMTYARLFLPRLLPDCKFVLYCDVDFWWGADISELWKVRDSRYIVQAVIDEHISRVGSPEEDAWGSKFHYSFDRKHYFNAGLCIFNLDKLRIGVADHLIQIMHGCPNAPMYDQTIMNAVFDKKDIGFLPARWQHLLIELTEQVGQEPIAIHYAAYQPWRAENAKLISDAMLVWFQEYGRVCGISTLRALGTVHNTAFAVFSRLAFLFATSSGFGH